MDMHCCLTVPFQSVYWFMTYVANTQNVTFSSLARLWHVSPLCTSLMDRHVFEVLIFYFQALTRNQRTLETTFLPKEMKQDNGGFVIDRIPKQRKKIKYSDKQ